MKDLYIVEWYVDSGFKSKSYKKPKKALKKLKKMSAKHSKVYLTVAPRELNDVSC